MQSFSAEPKRKSNKTLVMALVVGAIIVVALISLYSLKPSMQQSEESFLAGAVREGSPEFDALTKKIAIQTDDNRLMESATAMGTIMMSVGGRIRNMTGRTITGLEVKVTIVDQLDKPVREKLLTVVPRQQARLEANQTVDVIVQLEGFKPDEDRANIKWKVTAIKVE